jgi:hypothetical protein
MQVSGLRSAPITTLHDGADYTSSLGPSLYRFHMNMRLAMTTESRFTA